VEVDPLFEVDVEEVIGHRPPGRGPTADAIVKTAFEVGAVLVEMNEFRVALLHPANVNALRGDFKLARKPDAQSRQSIYFMRKHCHGDHHMRLLGLLNELAFEKSKGEAKKAKRSKKAKKIF